MAKKKRRQTDGKGPVWKTGKATTLQEADNATRELWEFFVYQIRAKGFKRWDVSLSFPFTNATARFWIEETEDERFVSHMWLDNGTQFSVPAKTLDKADEQGLKMMALAMRQMIVPQIMSGGDTNVSIEIGGEV